jgi:hypothetical protein
LLDRAALRAIHIQLVHWLLSVLELTDLRFRQYLRLRGFLVEDFASDDEVLEVKPLKESS